MHLIICLDSQNGWQFHNRRQSMDRSLRQDMMEYTADGKLWMDRYAASQFADLPADIQVCDSCIDRAGQEDFCFLERGDLSCALAKAQKLTVYRWDKVYPADKAIQPNAFACFSLQVVQEFSGYSHLKIKREAYIREEI